MASKYTPKPPPPGFQLNKRIPSIFLAVYVSVLYSELCSRGRAFVTSWVMSPRTRLGNWGGGDLHRDDYYVDDNHRLLHRAIFGPWYHDILLQAALEPSDVALTTLETMRAALKPAISKADDLLEIGL